MRIKKIPRRIFLYLIVLIAFVLVTFVAWKAKDSLENYGEERIKLYVESEIKLDVEWGKLSWNILYSRVGIKDLKIRGGEEFDTDLQIDIGNLESYYNPIFLLKERLLDLKNVRIEGIKGSIGFLGDSPFEKLKTLTVSSH